MKGHKVRQQRGFRIFTTKTANKSAKRHQARKKDKTRANSGFLPQKR